MSVFVVGDVELVDGAIVVVVVVVAAYGVRKGQRAQLDNESWRPWWNHIFFYTMRICKLPGQLDHHKHRL